MKHNTPNWRSPSGALLLVLIGLSPLITSEAVAAVYYLSNQGSDDNNGQTSQTPWRTIGRLNKEQLRAGDVVHFRRGDCWRERLVPCSGNEKGSITYSAYGAGDKPLLLGSVEKNDPKDWKNEAGCIWTAVEPIAKDVGNIIFNGEASCGVKVFNESELNTQGKYWYDQKRHVLKLYSSKCPASFYKDLECAIDAHIIDQTGRHHVIYDNLALKYGGAHGIGGANTHHIIVRNCDFSYIGGGILYMDGRTVRFGNGVEFWANAHDNLVERCRLWEIYDAALTNQNMGSVVKQYNIIYRNNLIWNSEYSYEYWNRPEASETHHIYFENNTCVNAGHGWGHTQRPDPSGRHLCFYTAPAKAHDIYVRNNIFFEAKGNAFFAPKWLAETMAALHMDNNCWFQREGIMILLKDRDYTMPQFPTYQTKEGKEANSIIADPQLADVANRDFHLTKKSPCIDAGTDVGLTADYDGKPIPQGSAPDIGAYECPQE